MDGIAHFIKVGIMNKGLYKCFISVIIKNSLTL